MNPNWFNTRKIRDGLYLTTEDSFYDGNRANIWLIKGPEKDVIIDTGLGVCNLRKHLESIGLIDGTCGTDGERECKVICTHNHFDHCGGAQHFENVYIHEEDLQGLRNGRQTETLNYVKPPHFFEQPYEGFSALRYKVPPTPCQPLKNGDTVELGGDENLEVIHLPGHTKGSIAIHLTSTQELFTGDFLYDSGSGGNLIDWLPASSVHRYIDSAAMMIDWMQDNNVTKVYPGHFEILETHRAVELLEEYVRDRESVFSKCGASCMQTATLPFFFFGCFRCCPCDVV